uniref:Uncharacterized protein n=1 Tax=Anguilla anguilla TaxID=7936 RepID=A0A0E9S184_ANGAN
MPVSEWGYLRSGFGNLLGLKM